MVTDERRTVAAFACGPWRDRASSDNPLSGVTTAVQSAGDARRGARGSRRTLCSPAGYHRAEVDDASMPDAADLSASSQTGSNAELLYTCLSVLMYPASRPIPNDSHRDSQSLTCSDLRHLWRFQACCLVDRNSQSVNNLQRGDSRAAASTEFAATARFRRASPADLNTVVTPDILALSLLAPIPPRPTTRMPRPVRALISNMRAKRLCYDSYARFFRKGIYQFMTIVG